MDVSGILCTRISFWEVSETANGYEYPGAIFPPAGRTIPSQISWCGIHAGMCRNCPVGGHPATHAAKTGDDPATLDYSDRGASDGAMEAAAASEDQACGD